MMCSLLHDQWDVTHWYEHATAIKRRRNTMPVCNFGITLQQAYARSSLYPEPVTHPTCLWCAVRKEAP